MALTGGKRLHYIQYQSVEYESGRKGKAAFSTRVGIHVSIARGIEKAIFRAGELGCTTMQIFSRNPRGWKAKSLSEKAVSTFREVREKNDIDPIIIHTPYLLNLASADETLHRRSTLALALDIRRAEQLGAGFVVTHLGSTGGKRRASGLKRVVRALKEVIDQESPVVVLLENSAGAGNSVGTVLEELQEIIDRVGKSDRLGVCFDSCHGYAAGYDFRSPKKTEALAKKIDQTIGKRCLALLHLNDCSGDLGAHRDRHQHIGRGKIGLAGFQNLLSHPSFQEIPIILETPKDSPDDDSKNLARIRRILKTPSPVRESLDGSGSLGK